MRPPNQGAGGVSSDVIFLTRALRRAEQDDDRNEKQKRELCSHIRAALALLLMDSGPRPPAKKRGPKHASP